MVEKYTHEQLVNFVDSIRAASAEIAKAKPSFYMVSLTGGLPLFDILRIVDRNVDASQAIYFPTASRIKDSSEVVTRCFQNFITEKMDETTEPRVIANLDEVVSGNSVDKIMNGYNSASRRVARQMWAAGSHTGNQRDYVEAEAEQLRRQFPFRVFGIREVRPDGSKMKAGYLQQVKRGEISEFPTDKIITMDDPDFETVKFAHPTSTGFCGQSFFPKVKELVSTDNYLKLLGDVARYVGVDPESVEPSRARVASDCEKYSCKPGSH